MLIFLNGTRMRIVFNKRDGVGMGATHPKLAPLPFLSTSSKGHLFSYNPCTQLSHMSPASQSHLSPIFYIFLNYFFYINKPNFPQTKMRLLSCVGFL